MGGIIIGAARESQGRDRLMLAPPTDQPPCDRITILPPSSDIPEQRPCLKHFDSPRIVDVFFIYKGSSLGSMGRRICLCHRLWVGGNGLKLTLLNILFLYFVILSEANASEV